MPLFGSSTPFDHDVEKVTNEGNTSEDWGLIMDICDRINATPNASKDAFKSIMKRLKHHVPHVALQSLTLLNACMNNCGRPFQMEVSSSDFCSEARNIISKGHSKVAEKLKSLLKDWAEEYKSEAALSLLVQLYNSLKSEGVSFPAGTTTSTTKESSWSPPKAEEDEDDIAKAIRLSLQDAEQSKSTPKVQYPSLAPSSYTYASAQPIKREPRKVKALYDFEAVEDNELTFKAGEIISVLDDSDVNWWKGENFRGVGLFPSNFVSADLTAETEPEMKEREKKVQFQEEVTVKTIEPPEVVEVNEEQLDQCLVQLQNADPTEERPDTQEMLVLEDTCNRMAPLIDQELEQIDRQLEEYGALNQKLLDAFSMYHSLMREAPVYGYSLQGMQTYPGSSMPPGAMHMTQPSMAQPPQQAYYPQGGIPQGVSSVYSGPQSQPTTVSMELSMYSSSPASSSTFPPQQGTTIPQAHNASLPQGTALPFNSTTTSQQVAVSGVPQSMAYGTPQQMQLGSYQTGAPSQPMMAPPPQQQLMM